MPSLSIAVLDHKVLLGAIDPRLERVLGRQQGHIVLVLVWDVPADGHEGEDEVGVGHLHGGHGDEGVAILLHRSCKENKTLLEGTIRLGRDVLIAHLAT